MSTQTQQPETFEIITRQEVAKRLGISAATVKRADDKGLITGFRINGPRSTVRYVWSEVLEALRNSRGGVYAR